MLLCVLLLVLIFWGIIYLADLPAFNIQSVTIEGNLVTPTADIQKIVDDDLFGDYLYFFPKTNTFLYPKKRITADILAAWPRISAAGVGTDSLTSLRVEITEKKPEALWCGTDLQASDGGGQCYFLDSDAFVFSSAPQFSGDVFVRFYGPLFETESSSTPLGAHYLPPDEFSAIDQYVSLLRSGLGLHPLIVETKEISALGDDELTLMGGSRILFNDRVDPQQAINNIRLFLAQNKVAFMTGNEATSTAAAVPAAATTSKATLTSGEPLIDYIDVRYGGDIYYKTK